MRPLFFDAVAENPAITSALMGQSAQALGPFTRFLTQAIHTAKQRQVRYELKWKRVRFDVELRLVPRDTRLLVAQRRPGLLVSDWPEGREPNLAEPLVIVNRRGHTIDVLASARSGSGLRIETREALLETDHVFWDGRECRLSAEPEAPPPSRICDEHGEPLRLARPPEPDGQGHFHVVVEGSVEEGATLLIDGVEAQARLLDPLVEVRRLVDERGVTFELSGSALRTAEPPQGVLRADNGVRFDALQKQGERRPGCWIELLLPEKMDDTDFIDPRAAFCDEGVDKVWTDRRHSEETTCKVKRVDRDRYQLLLDRYPPEGSSLFLPVDVRSLQLQRRAIRQLEGAPLPHHRGLLRLCEDPRHARWPAVTPFEPERWYSLTDMSRSGTDEQRRFVRKALGSKDLAILEGPPGSGKTTAICEIAQQLLSNGKRVLMCASTNVAIDNVLERLIDGEVPVDAVRIGRPDRVDPKVQATLLDARVEALLATWRSDAALGKRGTAELRSMAERTVVLGANLTCGTTMGILQHPLLRERPAGGDTRDMPLCVSRMFDVLIVDEASKTLIQELLVPALLAQRHIVVGDVRQLPPFTDRGDLVANLEALIDRNGREIFPPEHQRARLLLFKLGRRDVREAGQRWLVVEPPGVLDFLALELAQRRPELSVVRVVRRRSAGAGPAVREVTLDEVRRGDAGALWLAVASWVLVERELLAGAAPHLPPNMLVASDLTRRGGLPERDAFGLRQAWWTAHLPPLTRRLRDGRDELATPAKLEEHLRAWLDEHTWAGEVAWRLTRAHELRWSKNARDRERLHAEIKELLPGTVEVEPAIEDIRDIGLPSILEVIQTGIGEARAHRRSALTEGLGRHDRTILDARFETLTFQHRMHPTIAAFAREEIYEGASLRDANTIAIRDAEIGWDYRPELPSRRVWIDVQGREQGGKNPDEIAVMRAIVSDFLTWAKRKGPPRRERPAAWEVACLCFYSKQEEAIREMLAELLGQGRSSRHSVDGVDIVCGTVDRFQGREADVAILSMRNTRRIGFLNSPNRLNVALTRARQQVFVLGNAEYFAKCQVSELTALAGKTKIMTRASFHGRGQR